jgi:hypothetical protein
MSKAAKGTIIGAVGVPLPEQSLRRKTEDLEL